MFSRIKKSLGRINYKLYLALLVLGLCPTIYTTVRVFFLGQLPSEWSYSIAGQLSWVNLLYEVLNEAIILPLFYFVGKVREDKVEFANRVRTGLLISLSAYAILSVVVIIFAEPMLRIMATDVAIIKDAVSYIRIESIANVFLILMQFALVALVTVNKSKYLYALTLARLVLCLSLDTFLVSELPISAKLGINGIGYSNIIVNAILFAISVWLLSREGISVFAGAKLRFSWIKEFVRVGGISGAESFVRNLAYMVMIARMVNVVGVSDVDKIFELVLILVGFYVLYAIQNVFDSTFYGLGKTHYMLFESVVTNTVYYGIAFVLYITNVWQPSLIGIALLFGIGNAFDSVVSLIAYVFLLKKNRYII